MSRAIITALLILKIPCRICPKYNKIRNAPTIVIVMHTLLLARMQVRSPSVNFSCFIITTYLL